MRHHSVFAKPLVELDRFFHLGQELGFAYLRNVVHPNECSNERMARLQFVSPVSQLVHWGKNWPDGPYAVITRHFKICLHR